MDSQALRHALLQVSQGGLSVDEAFARLSAGPLAVGAPAARVDHGRAARCGVPEVIYCASKTPDEVAAIAAELVGAGQDLLATRASPEAYEAVRRVVPEARYAPRARAIYLRRKDAPPPVGLVAVVTAGTSDIPVAEEARITLETLGSRVEASFDVGVAGVHRVLAVRDNLARARAVIVVAGMEGALASVVGGLVPCPVIGVPTSVGYGVALGGMTALFGMLTACTPTVSVVNIDNGFGAAVVAHRINMQAEGAACARGSSDKPAAASGSAGTTA